MALRETMAQLIPDTLPASSTAGERRVFAALARLPDDCLIYYEPVACYKLDRIGRSVVHLAKLLEELEERGVHFMTAEDGLSTKGSTGKLVLNILGSIAQFERDLILERTRAGLAA